MRAEEILAQANATNVVAAWDDAHKYTPAPRHRRRLVLNMLRGLDFADVLDAGCAQPYLLEAIVECFGVPGFGCDISDEVMAANRARMPQCQFEVVDLTRGGWSGGRQFDLVVSSEVLEHIPQWRVALGNLAKMTRKHLLITVPSGKIRTMDRLVGHHQHFQGPELTDAIRQTGLEIVQTRFWGFPVHSLYKRLISLVGAERLYTQYSGGERYSFSQRLMSHTLNGMFYVNDLVNSGDQLLVLARRA